jgi:predicted nucleotidyltransferase
MNLEPVRRVLDSFGVRYALIGAHAMAARGYPRFTVDVDLLTTDLRVLDAPFWAALERDGTQVDARRGDADDPLGGVVHLLLDDGTDVDVVVGKWQWEADLIERADEISIGGAPIRVPSIADLIILKLAAGGTLDLHDAAALLAVADRATVVRDIDAHIADVRPDIRGAWNDLQAATDR